MIQSNTCILDCFFCGFEDARYVEQRTMDSEYLSKTPLLTRNADTKKADLRFSETDFIPAIFGHEYCS